MEPWRTGIVDADQEHIRIRGYDVTALMTRVTFTDTIFLLHRGRLPDSNERALLDAILTGVADHGSGAPSCAAARLAASGNRQSLSAAVAAGVLTIGDEHGGAGSTCMEMIAAVCARARAGALSMAEVAAETVSAALAAGERLPGLGHRVHKVDPRTAILFGMTRQVNLAGEGLACMEALESAIRNQGKTISINIDGALAAILHDLGFPPPFGKLVFIIGRVAGLTAEVAEEYEREKPMRVRIPLTYDGVPPRELP
ncbi:MAG: citryl-CoA lyase [Acidobacteriota bacterium]